MDMNDIRLVHLADIHLGYTGPINFVFGAGEHAEGRYVREVDIENAIRRITRDIVDQQPPVDVVVVAGDLFHKPNPYPRAIVYAARMVHTLILHDIEVVIIDGNHETSNWLHTGSPTSFLRELGAHVINESAYEIIRDDNWCSQRLKEKEKLAIHALPYRAVYDRAFTGVTPLAGYVNVLLTHGRVHGMDELNSLHHASAGLPKDLLRRGWHYVALGDWHIHGYHPLHDAPAYYAGSLEALNFGEAAFYPPRQDDPYSIHGALDIRLALNKDATVHTLANTNHRPVLRLESIDAVDLDPETLMETLRKRFGSNLPLEAVVFLEVKNCPSKTWDQLDHAEIEQLRKLVRRCEIRWDIQQPSSAQSSEALSEASLDDQWQHYLDQMIEDETERAWYSQQGLILIDSARKELLAARASTGDEGE